MINAKYVDGLELRIRELSKKLSDEADAALQLIAENKSLKGERDAYLAELQKANAVIIDLQRNPPKLLKEHLAEVKAQAGRDGFIAGYNECWRQVFGTNVPEYATGYSADQYADSIRKESEK